ncbi:MAG: peptidoglycan DD-metalloendopeptidase family protein [Balneolaceae bacterium]
MTARLILLTAFLLLTGGHPLFAQSSYEQRRAEILERQETTRNEIQSLEDQIQIYQNRLELSTERYEEMYSQYEQLTRLIALQDERIRRMEQEQRDVVAEIRLITENIEELERELARLVEEYKSTLTYLYKHGRTTELALILTAESINQLLVRSHYLTLFDRHLTEQTRQIEQTQADLVENRGDLIDTQQRNETILAEIENEKEELSRQEQQQMENIRLLQRDRDNLQDQLTTVERELTQLNDALTASIEEEERLRRAEEERLRQLAAAEEIEDESEREAAIARYSQPAARTAAVSDEELSAYEVSFSSSRGQLPWPVSGGTITEKFGVRVHPVFNTRTDIPGIDIAVPAQSQVRVVHDGYVIAVQPGPGFGNMVIVSHGRYYTVYGNLHDIFVSRGSVLRQGDVIGLSGDENSVRGEVLFFLVREGTQNLNPEEWIQRNTP